MLEARGAIARPGMRWTAVLVAFAAGAATAAASLALHAFPDFMVFWTAARHASDPLLYDAAHLNAAPVLAPGAVPPPFIYPPTFLLLAYPFGFLPAVPAYLLWDGLAGAALVAAAQQVVRPAWVTIALPLFLPVLTALGYGQSTPFAAAALIAGAAQLDRRPQLAGALIAVAACIKPQLMILSPLLLIGSWPALRAALAAGCALVAASLAFGPEHWSAWLQALPQFQATVRKLPLGFINLLDPRFGLAVKALVVGCGIGFAFWCARRSPAERVVGVVAGSLCCTLYAARADIVVLAPVGLAWVLDGWTAAGWVRRGAGAALILGAVGAPAAVAALMVAACAAGLLEERPSGPSRRPSPGAGRAQIAAEPDLYHS